MKRCEFQYGPCDGAQRDVDEPLPSAVKVLGHPGDPSEPTRDVPVYTYVPWPMASGRRRWYVYVLQGKTPILPR